MARWRGSAVAIAAVVAASANAAVGVAPEQPSPQVRALVRAMTLDEKVNFITGAPDPDYKGQAGYAPGLPRLHIPPLRWVNGPTGIEADATATAVPQGVTLAATFDVDLARRFGRMTGLEARALGMDVVNGPQLDIARIPNWGRNPTALGEDPLLSGRIGAAEIEGIQAQGVLATTKHYLAYTQAQHVRTGTSPNTIPYDFIVDQRTLHEIYLPSFEAAARAGTASFMAAHVVVNGHYGSENAADLTGILRDELHWDGYVVSDWNAVHVSKAIEAGLDVEMPGYGIQGAAERPYYFGDKLAVEVRAGRIPEAAVDRAVGRVLGQMSRFGLLDGRRPPRPASIDVEQDAAVSREIAVKGAVLLKNEGALPLAASALASTVLIGPTANQLAVGAGNGRAYGFEAREVSPLAVMRMAEPGLAYAVGDDLTGVAIPASALSPASGQGSGLTRAAKGGATAVDQTLDFVGGAALPAGTSATWTGTLTAPEGGDYLLMVQSWGGSAVLKVDGQQKATSAKVATHGFPRKWSSVVPTADGLDNGQTNIRLEAGRTYRIAVEVSGDTPNPVQVRLAWVTPEMRRRTIAEAAAAAARAKTAVVFVWGRSGELLDPEENLALPNGQDALIEAVAAANPNTVVVLNTGGPVRMPWLGKVRAVLEMWYPGQEGGWASADLLTGRANPSGKLPITFPVRMADTPAGDPAHPERSVGVDGKIVMTDGIFVGYRHYDQQGIAPLFPFGHGLSYTRFVYSGLTLRRAKAGVDVAFTVRNAGARAGAEAPQVYLGPVRSGVPMPPKALAGFTRVQLAPGEARLVRIHVPERQLAYWSVERRGWTRARGPRPVYVGSSSRDIRLTGRLDAG